MILPKQKIIQRVIISLILIIGFLLAVNTFTSNDSKPLVTVKTYVYLQENVVNKLPENNSFQRYIKKHIPLSLIAPLARPDWNIYHFSYLDQVYFSNRSIARQIEWINAYVPENEPIYHTIPSSMFEYGLFGRNITRQVYPVSDLSMVEAGYYLRNSPLDDSILGETVTLIDSMDNLFLYQINPR